MTLGERELRVARQRAETHGTTARRNGVEDPAAVGDAADVVRDHRGEIERGVELLEADCDGGDAARGRARVHHEQDGRREPLRDLRRRAVLAHAVDAVEAAHHPFDDDDVGIRPVLRHRRAHGVTAAHPAVERVGRTSGDERVERGVDEVGADLEPLHREPAAPECRHDGQRHRSLADAAGDAADDDGAAHEPLGPSTPADLNVAISP